MRFINDMTALIKKNNSMQFSRVFLFFLADILDFYSYFSP
jgi:hypothetical protein